MNETIVIVLVAAAALAAGAALALSDIAGAAAGTRQWRRLPGSRPSWWGGSRPWPKRRR